jgi:hypothetical protein
VREDELARILQTGATAVAEAVRPQPPEAVRARGDQRRRHKRLGSALLALAVLAGASGVYAGVRTGIGSTPASHQGTRPRVHVGKGVPVPAPGEQTPPPGSAQMLPAGKTGTPPQIPWPVVDSSWTFTEFSSGTVGNTGNWRQGGGQLTLSLVDPEGGRYTLYQQANTGQPWTLLDEGAGGEQTLLGVGRPDGQGRYPGYRVVSTATGALTTVTLPADVTPGGFNFSGYGLLAVRRTLSHAWLQVYSPTGHLQTTLASESIPPGDTGTQPCLPSCRPLLEPDGSQVAWNDGTGLQLVSIKPFGSGTEQLTVPGAGSACAPLRWWDDETVLASCGTGAQARLWLVRNDGVKPTALTPPGSAASGYGPYTGAWKLAGTVYVNRAAGASCQGTAGGPGTSGFYSTGRNGALSPFAVVGSTRADLTGTAYGSLLVLASTGCPGGTGLMAFNVSAATPSVTWLQRASSGQAGVVAAVPFGP